MELFTQQRRAVLDYSEDTLHNVEVRREQAENGELGSFGFTLLYEKPPIVGTIVPGGSADKAGLKTNEIVTAVNGRNIVNFTHTEVVSYIYNTTGPSVWLSVCEPANQELQKKPLGRGLGSSPMSQSTSALPRNFMEPKRPIFENPYENGSPQYLQERGKLRAGSLGHRAVTSSMATISPGVSPLKRKALMSSFQNGQELNQPDGVSMSRTSPVQQKQQTSYNTITVQVQYLGRVELPESWSARGLSSSCIKECTRRLLGTRQDVLEVQLEMTLGGLKVYNSNRCMLIRHKREELYYTGVCTDDEQYFAIVARKMEKPSGGGGTKALINMESREMPRASMCHVFKIIPGSSTVALLCVPKEKGKQGLKPKSGYVSNCVPVINAFKFLFQGDSYKLSSISFDSAPHKQDPSIYSYGGVGTPGNIYTSSPNRSPPQLKKKKPEIVDLRQESFSSLSSTSSSSKMAVSPSSSFNAYELSPSSGGGGGGGGGGGKGGPPQRDIPTSLATPAYINSRMEGGAWYSSDSPVPGPSHRREGSYGNEIPLASRGSFGNNLTPSPLHRRAGSYGNEPIMMQLAPDMVDYRSRGDPVVYGEGYPLRRSGGGNEPLRRGGGEGGFYGNGSSGFARKEAMDPQIYGRNMAAGYGQDRPSGNHGNNTRGGFGGGKKDSSRQLAFPPAQHDVNAAKKASDESSASSLSSSRTSSPTKSLSLRSSFASRSRSPSPARSLSHSSSRSRSRSRSPPALPSRESRFTTATGGSGGNSKFLPLTPARAGRGGGRLYDLEGLDLETSSRSGAISPLSTSLRGSRPLLRRNLQGSESSLMEVQGLPGHEAPYSGVGGGPRGLPERNGPLTSSIGSVATLTTLVDEEKEPEEVGRVAGWVASFDKLLADPLGVQCLLEMLTKEHCEENVLFWRDVEEFAKKAPQSQNLQAEVKKIYDQYLSPSSPQSINVDDRVYKNVEAKLANPPLNIFKEAQEQIYQLMKMDCYPRFKRSQLAKECLMAEMEGKPLPITLSSTQEKPITTTTRAGIWQNHRQMGFGQSLWQRLAHTRQQQSKGVFTGPTNKGEAKKKKKATIKRTESASPHFKKASKDQHKGSKVTETKPAVKEESTEYPSEDPLKKFIAHKGNIYEINLPNKVTKIMEVPSSGSIYSAVGPVLKKHGYSFETMELRFANTLKPVDLSASAQELTGQHIIVVKSKNTFIALFDSEEKILPANSSSTVGELLTSVIRERGKAQSFAVYLEGSRVPLEQSVETSILVGQRVVVKLLQATSEPGLESSPQNRVTGKVSKNPSLRPITAQEKEQNAEEMDDLFSMIARLASDTLEEQRSSQTPRTTPEPGTGGSQQDLSDYRSSPDSDQYRERTSSSPSIGRKGSPSVGRKGSPLFRHKSSAASKKISPKQKKKLSTSKSYNTIDEGSPEGVVVQQQPNQVQPSSSLSAQKAFVRTSSGGPVHLTAPPRQGSQRSLSPPPPTIRPPPLPAGMQGGGAGGGLHQRAVATGNKPPLDHRKLQKTVSARLSGASFKSTDSGSSEDSMGGSGGPGNYGRGGLNVPSGPRDIRSHSMGSNDYFPSAFSRESLERQQQLHPQAHGYDPTYVNTNPSQHQQQEAYHQQRGPGVRSKSTASVPNPGGIVYRQQQQQQQQLHHQQQQQTQTQQPHVMYDRRVHSWEQERRSPPVTSEYHSLPIASQQQPHPLDSVVSDACAYSNSISQQHPHSRQQSWPIRQQGGGGPGGDGGGNTHPLHNAVKEPAPGIPPSSYPWHQAHVPGRRSSQTRATQRRNLTEDPHLITAGEKLMQREIDEYRQCNSDTSSINSGGSNEQGHPPLSPTTHMLVIPDEGEESKNRDNMRETFV